jgi:hypothetical protein
MGRRSLSTTLCHVVWLNEPPEDGAGLGKGSSMDGPRDDAWMCEGTMVLHGHPVCRVLKTLQQVGYCWRAKPKPSPLIYLIYWLEGERPTKIGHSKWHRNAVCLCNCRMKLQQGNKSEVTKKYWKVKLHQYRNRETECSYSNNKQISEARWRKSLVITTTCAYQYQSAA